MLLALDVDEIRNVIVVGVGVVKEPALFRHQPTRMNAGAIAAIPAHRTFAAGALERLDRQTNVLAFLGLGQAEHFFPAVTVAADFMTQFDGGLGHIRVLLESHRAGMKGRRDVGLLQDVEDPPDADAGAVLIHRLHRQIAHAVGKLIAAPLGHALLVRITHGQGALRAFFVIDDKVDGQARAVGPGALGALPAVADQISNR